MLRPFFTFFGGKWRAAPRYPAPRHGIVVEPFAGAAGYSLRHSDRDIVLVERDPTIAALWRWLIASTAGDILALPATLPDGATVSDLDVPPEARSLIGFWLNKGTTQPGKSPSRWMRDGLRPNSFWGQAIRQRVAEQVGGIKHWTVIEGDYSSAPDAEATWFIDPPYQEAGRAYRFGSNLLDFEKLSEWCRSRRGQVIVCENEGASWLPFQPYLATKALEGRSGKSVSKEAIWLNG